MPQSSTASDPWNLPARRLGCQLSRLQHLMQQIQPPVQPAQDFHAHRNAVSPSLPLPAVEPNVPRRRTSARAQHKNAILKRSRAAMLQHPDRALSTDHAAIMAHCATKLAEFESAPPARIPDPRPTLPQKPPADKPQTRTPNSKSPHAIVISDSPRPSKTILPTQTPPVDTSHPDNQSVLDSILAFARGETTALSKVEKGLKKTVLRTRVSLATIKGCEQFANVNVFGYIRALCIIHTNEIAILRANGAANVREQVKSLCSHVSRSQWRAIISQEIPRTRAAQSELYPPPIESTSDVVQFVFRLVQKMAQGDESIARSFMDRMYKNGVVKDVAAMVIGAVKLWRSSKKTAQCPEDNRNDLIEWCLRLLSNFLVFEISPFSPIYHSRSMESSYLLISSLHEDKFMKFQDIIDVGFEYTAPVSVLSTRECRFAVWDLVQCLVIHKDCPFPNNSVQRSSWEKIATSAEGYLSKLMESNDFWMLVNGVTQMVIRTDRLMIDAKLGVAFLVSLLSMRLPSKLLLEKQTKSRKSLLELLLKILERIGKQPLACFKEVQDQRDAYPGLHTFVDLVPRLMSSAVVQRELCTSTDTRQRDKYLDAIQELLTRSEKLVPGTYDADQQIKFARDCTLGGRIVDANADLERDFIAKESRRSSDDEREGRTPEQLASARRHALAFVAKILGSLGKSMEDGSRDISQMNSLRALMSSRYRGSRRLLHLWDVVFRIQRGLERFDIDNEQEPEKSLLSPLDRNCFAMVVERIRSQIVSEHRDRSSSGTGDESAKISSPTPGKTFSSKGRSVNASMPDVSQLKEIRMAVSSAKGYRDLDVDPTFMMNLSNSAVELGHQVLARFDPESDLVSKWVKLKKGNVYVERARDLLAKEDKVLGTKCGCIPGNPKENGDDFENKIACSNDLCENRSTKVECVPGECGAGAYCQNQRMQKLEYAKFKMSHFKDKGIGMIADEDIKGGAFIGEYQGEVISQKLFEQRKRQYEGERHFYFMTLTSKLVIDASRKSQATRFVNHSCDPNAETQKWNAGGEPRVGIFAKRDIPKGEEITFDYGAASLANNAVPCLCGAKNCRGWLTSKKADAIEEEITVDKANLANPAERLKPDTARSTLKSCSIPSEETLEDGLDIISDMADPGVEDKLSRAHKYIALGKNIKESCDITRGKLQQFDESKIGDIARKKLTEWESSLKRQEDHESNLESVFSSSTLRRSSAAELRIPRRKPSTAQVKVDSKTPTPNVPRSGETAKVSATEIINVDAPKALPSRPDTSYPQPDRRRPDLGNDRHSRSGRSSIGHIDSRRGTRPIGDIRKSPRKSDTKEIGTIDKPVVAKKQTSGRTFGGIFAPTQKKYQRPLPVPKQSRRTRIKNDGSDSDSMDAFSIASSAEPIMDEPPLSPSQLPNGNGACSDDEFVAAPPVEATLMDRKNDYSRGERAMENRRQSWSRDVPPSMKTSARTDQQRRLSGVDTHEWNGNRPRNAEWQPHHRSSPGRSGPTMNSTGGDYRSGAAVQRTADGYRSGQRNPGVGIADEREKRGACRMSLPGDHLLDHGDQYPGREDRRMRGGLSGRHRSNENTRDDTDWGRNQNLVGADGRDRRRSLGYGGDPRRYEPEYSRGGRYEQPEVYEGRRSGYGDHRAPAQDRGFEGDWYRDQRYDQYNDEKPHTIDGERQNYRDPHGERHNSQIGFRSRERQGDWGRTGSPRRYSKFNGRGPEPEVGPHREMNEFEQERKQEPSPHRRKTGAAGPKSEDAKRLRGENAQGSPAEIDQQKDTHPAKVVSEVVATSKVSRKPESCDGAKEAQKELPKQDDTKTVTSSPVQEAKSGEKHVEEIKEVVKSTNVEMVRKRNEETKAKAADDVEGSTKHNSGAVPKKPSSDGDANTKASAAASTIGSPASKGGSLHAQGKEEVADNNGTGGESSGKNAPVGVQRGSETWKPVLDRMGKRESETGSLRKSLGMKRSNSSSGFLEGSRKRMHVQSTSPRRDSGQKSRRRMSGDRLGSRFSGATTQSNSYDKIRQNGSASFDKVGSKRERPNAMNVVKGNTTSDLRALLASKKSRKQ